MLWQEFSGMTSLNLAWVITGDFNSITSVNKHKEGSYGYYSRKSLFFALHCFK